MSVWCWWCCHPFEGNYLQMPYKHDERRNKFYTAGHFCSWSCMKTYAIDKYGCNRGGLICGNMVMMRRQVFDKIGTIKRAPHREKLKVFGGNMTIEQFRENNVVDKEEPKEIESVPVPEITVPIVPSTKKLEDIKSATGKNETLRLKREKPLKRNENNLESVLGLVIKTKT